METPMKTPMLIDKQGTHGSDCFFGMLTDKLAVTFNHEGSPAVSTTPPWAGTLTYLKKIGSALHSLVLTYTCQRFATRSETHASPEFEQACSIKKN